MNFRKKTYKGFPRKRMASIVRSSLCSAGPTKAWTASSRAWTIDSGSTMAAMADIIKIHNRRIRRVNRLAKECRGCFLPPQCDYSMNFFPEPQACPTTSPRAR